jgi:hypothetical protein
MTPAALFYALSSISMFGIWGGFTLMVGNDFHKRGSTAPVATCPSWLPHSVVLTLLRKDVYPIICHFAPVILALNAMAPDIRWLRLVTAACVAVYSLAETSVTHSHRDYAGLYSAVSLAVLPDAYAEAVALGVCVHFIAGSGWAKVLVGGLKGWSSPGTLRSVLRCYGEYSLGEAGPAFPAMNRLVAGSDALLTALSVKTLLFECLVIPASLFLPSHLRVYMVFASVALHFGIAAVQSGLVGLAFVPNISTYILGFGAEIPIGSTPWCVALAIPAASAVWTAVSFTRKQHLLPEDWPCTPFALFAWSGDQWDALFHHFVDSDTRLVLTPHSCENGPQPGSIVIPKEVNPSGKAPKRVPGDELVYNGWEQCVGETLVYGPVLATLLAAFPSMSAAKDAGKAWDASEVLVGIEMWLQAERRLVVTESGEPLTKAYFVRVKDGNRVEEVLAAGAGADKKAD